MSTIDIRMIKARSALIMLHAFFGVLSMRLHVVERSDIPTMATDGKSLFYSRKFLDNITENQVLFVIAHEVLHCALGHCVRRQGRDPNLWNLACDYVVNLMLQQAGFRDMPKGGLLNWTYAGLNAEQIFKILEQEKKEKEKQQCQSKSSAGTKADDGSKPGDGTSAISQEADAPQEPGSGSEPETTEGDEPPGSAGGTSPPETNYPPSHGDPGGCGEILDAALAHDEAKLAEVAEEWQVYTRQAAAIAKRQGEGRLPAFIEEILNTLDNPKVDWRVTLRRFADSNQTKDYTWQTPNRRNIAFGYITPGTVSDGINHIAIPIDSSGSVSTEWLQKFGGEAQGLLDEGAVEKITLLFVDTQVHGVREYNKGEIIDFTIQGRGGTNFVPAFEWINENIPDVSAVVYFTDLECSSFGPRPNYPVLWAAYGDDPHALRSYMEKVPFGETMELSD